MTSPAPSAGASPDNRDQGSPMNPLASSGAAPETPSPPTSLRRRVFDPRRLSAPSPVRPLIVLMGLASMGQVMGLAFVLLLPSIKGSYRVGLFVVTLIVALHLQLSLALDVPIALATKRRLRMGTACAGGLVLIACTVAAALAGMAGGVILLDFALFGVVMCGGAFTSVQNGLLADYYPPEIRPRVFYAHRAAVVGSLSLTPVLVAVLSRFFSWQVVLLLLVSPTVVFVAAGLGLTGPAAVRVPGRATEDDAALAGLDDEPPTIPETARVLLSTPSLRALYGALPFLVAALLGIRTFASAFYQNVLHLNAGHRNLILAWVEPAGFVGLVVGFVVVQRLMATDPARAIRRIALFTGIAGLCLAVFAVAPNLAVAVIAHVGFMLFSSWLLAGVYSVVSLAVPQRMVTLGFALTTVWFQFGILAVAPAGLSLTWAANFTFGYRTGMFVLVFVYLAGALVLASAGDTLNNDLEKLRLTAVADLEARRARAEGRAKLLMVRSLDAGYDGVQILFGVNLDIADGEIVAILGTNGAGKSTLLRAISGLTLSSAGEVLYDGRDITTTDPARIVAMGVLQVPGGRGIFPGLTVAESLRVSGWMYVSEPGYLAAAMETVLGYFPVLRDRWDTPAGSLSGGEQQMLSLAQAFIARPRLLMIDELSLGLAPTVIESLLQIVRDFHANGTTVILVEQSVNLALRLTDRAIFMEKGQVVFSGPTSELLGRDDIVRAVFLAGAGKPAVNAGGMPAPLPAGFPPTESLNGRQHPASSTTGLGSGGRRRASNGNAPPPLRLVPPGASAEPAKRSDDVVLSATGLRKRFGGIVAVDGVDLELFSGEILGLIGPNGAGKTTVFDLISGQLSSDGGKVAMFGEDISAWPAHRRAAHGMGRSFQAARLWPGLTVQETLGLAVAGRVRSPGVVASLLCLPTVGRAERRVTQAADEVIELLGLGDFRDHLASDLSTGTRRLAELAVMVAMRPTILLLDEPSAGIAQAETEALAPVLLQTKERLGCTIMIIEHDMGLMRNLAHRIAALDTGAVVVVGRPDEVLNHPRVVESYLGTTAH